MSAAPAHSIIRQASDSRLRLDAMSLNADGFGVGWCVRLTRSSLVARKVDSELIRLPFVLRYPSQVEEGKNDSSPGMFKSCTPA